MHSCTIPQMVNDSDVRYIPKWIPLSKTVRSSDNCIFSTKTYYDLTVGIFLYLENGDSVNMPSKIVPSPSKSVLYGSLAEDVLIV